MTTAAPPRDKKAMGQEKAKILHIITRLDRGGSARNTLLTCQGLGTKYRMVLVHGLSLESHMTPWEQETVEGDMALAGKVGVRILPLTWLVRRIDPYRDLRAFWALWRLLVREKPFLVHTHTSKAGILGRLAARLARVPVIVHTPHGHVFHGHFSPPLSRLFLDLERACSLITHTTIALTRGEREDYLRLRVCTPERSTVIHSGVPVDRYGNPGVNPEEMKESLGLEGSAPVVGFVGWLLPVKGPMHLLCAMARIWEVHPHTVLVFVGKGDQETELRAVAAQMPGSEKVKFLGWRDDIPRVMQVFDVFVLPSLNEGMGRVLVEAMAAGKPVVASRTGGIPDLVKNGRNGFLVPPGDTEGLAKAVTALLDNASLRRAMGDEGRRTACAFTVEAMVEKLDHLYGSHLRGAGGAPLEENPHSGKTTS